MPRRGRGIKTAHVSVKKTLHNTVEYKSSIVIERHRNLDLTKLRGLFIAR